MRPIILATILALTATQAAAQPPCGPREAVIAHLADRYGENRKALGMSRTGAVMEVWANIETGTWTVTHTRPGGPTCVVDSGQSFSPRDDLKPASGEPT